jgi:Flp pilus assembly protein TadD
MRRLWRAALAVTALSLVPAGACHACGCDSVDPAIEGLLGAKQWDEAEQRAAAAVANSDSREAHLCHAHAVLRHAAKSALGVNLEALNLPPDFKGDIQLDAEQTKQLFSDEVNLDWQQAAPAIAELRELTRRWPTDPHAHRCLLELYQKTHRDADVMAALREAAQSLVPHGNAAVDELIDFGHGYYASHDYAHAAEFFSLLVASYPKSEKAQSGYGAVLMGQGHLAAARSRFAQALALAPRDPIVLNNAALSAILDRDFAAAKRFYLRLREVQPDATSHYFSLAMLALADGPAAAVPVWKSYLARHREVPDEAAYAKWAESVLPVLEAQPTPRDLDALAQSLIGAHLMELAIPGLVGLTRSDPKEPVHHFLLAQCYENNHLLDVALAELQTTLTLVEANGSTRPEPASVQYELGRVALELEKTELAVTQLARAAEARPDFGDGQYTLGLAYQQAKRKDLSHAAFERCVSAKQPSSYIEWCRKYLRDADSALPVPASPAPH